jgi:hypothetical protein
MVFVNLFKKKSFQIPSRLFSISKNHLNVDSPLEPLIAQHPSQSIADTSKQLLPSTPDIQNYIKDSTMFNNTDLEIVLSSVSNTITLSETLHLLQKCSKYSLKTQNSIKVYKFLSFCFEKNPKLSKNITEVLNSIQKTLSKKYMNLIDINLTKEIISINSKFYKSNKSSDLMFRSLQSYIISKLENFDKSQTKDYSDILRIYVTARRGSESFLINIEKKVFENLDALTALEVFELYRDYNLRIASEYTYILYKLYAPIVDNFINRFESLDANLIVFFIRQMLQKNIYGLYHDPRLEAKLLNLLENFDLTSDSSYDIRIGLLNYILSYLSFVGLLNSEISLKINNLFYSIWKKHDQIRLINFAYFFSAFNETPDKFWKMVVENLPNIKIYLNDQSSRGVVFRGLFYTTLIMLRHSNPFMQSMLYKGLKDDTINSLEMHIKSDKFKDAVDYKKSFDHKLASEILDELEIPYTLEYYESGYMIDIFIPQKKIGIELCGPYHYIWPAGILNGQMLQKKYLLEKLKYKIFIIQFDMTYDVDKRKDDIKKEIINILSNS